MYDYKFGEIYHHGIKGQKWGERNGPPYPLGTKLHNAVVSGANKAKETAKKLDENFKKKQLSNLERSRKELEADIADWEKNGTKSEGFKRLYPGVGSDKAAKKEYERYLKERKDRLTYREKLLKGQKLTPEEEAMRRKDVALKCAGIGVTVLLAAYAASTFKEVYTTTGVMLPKQSVADVLMATSKEDVLKYALEDQDVVMKIGQQFYRQTPFADVDMSNPHMYVATNDIDKKLYRAFLGAGLRQGNEHYEAILKVTNEIKAPSLKKSVELLAEAMDDDEVFSFVAERAGITPRMESHLGVRRSMWNSLPEAEKAVALRRAYGRLNYEVVLDDSKPAAAYLKKVTEAGYNALSDLNDQGSFTTSPLVLLDAKGTIEQTGRKKISELDKKLATLTLPLTTDFKVRKAGSEAFKKIGGD